MASSYRDRTSEFRLLSETLKKIGSPVQPENAPSTSRGESYSRSEFNRKASRIGLGIHETSQKIARLTQLARKSSMFNDPAVEIQELTVLIKNEITALNSALFDLQTVQNTDMADGGYSQDTIVHSTAVCDDLKSKLMGATKHLQDVLTARTELRSLSRLLLGRAKESNYVQLLLGHSAWIRWALNGLTIGLEQKPSSSSCCERNWSTYSFVHSLKRNKMDSKDEGYSRGETRLWNIVEMHMSCLLMNQSWKPCYFLMMGMRERRMKQNIKAHENRKQIFSNNASRENPLQHQPKPTTEPPPWSNSSNASESLHQELALPSNGAPVGNQLRRRLAVDSTPSQQMEMSMVQQVVPRHDNYAQSRATALHNVESTITELSGIFSHLATMVAHQGELAIRIDDNMDESLANVEGAHSSLLRHLNRISSNRWLLIKIFVILILFLMIFIFFVA
ncbi:Syntaxin-31 [Glycine max]|nr:Syntaxin-31 [Glycine max]KAH1211884.1 Syntaxin-31 [Glycine max]